MLIQVPAVLTSDQLRNVQTRLDNAGAAWVDGRATAGHQGAQVKRNLQIAEDSTVAREVGDVILSALERNPLFISAVLPDRVYPPMFNRYEGGMHFGEHVDGAIRLLPGTGIKIRTDLSATLFLSDPARYDGGELNVVDTYGSHAVKLAAGDMVVYPAGSKHSVAPVTRGVRTACVFWVQSLIRDDAQRVLLFELDQAVQRLNATAADDAARVQLTGCYHNLLRMWGDT